MQPKKEIANKAASHFLKGYNCAESVLMTMAEAFGEKNAAVPKVATPFGAGIARQGFLCGCIAGGVMSIGLKHGRSSLNDDRKKAYDLTVKFCRKFENKFGSLICRELIGCDFHTEAGLKKFEDIKEEKCANFVREAVMILLDLLC